MIDNLKFSNIGYINKNIKEYNGIKITIIFLLILVAILYFTKYEKTYETYGYVIKEENYYIKTNIYLEDIQHITSSNKLSISKKDYTYKIHNISSDLYIDTSLKNYKEITIELSENRNYTLNEVIKFKINIGKERTIKVIINYLFRKE